MVDCGSDPSGSNAGVGTNSAAARVKNALGFTAGANRASDGAPEKTGNVESLVVVAGSANCGPFLSVGDPVSAMRGSVHAPFEHGALVVGVPEGFVDRSPSGGSRRKRIGPVAKDILKQCLPGLFSFGASMESETVFSACPYEARGGSVAEVVGEAEGVPMSPLEAR